MKRFLLLSLLFSSFITCGNKKEAKTSSSSERHLSSDVDFKYILSIAKVMNTIKNSYVKEEKSEKDLFEAAIKGMMSSLSDPYSYYVSREDLDSMCKEYIEGSFDGGIGVLMLKFTDSDSIIVVEVLQGSPAEKAGLKRGDKIVKIDNQTLEGKKSKDCVEIIKGKENTYVTLSIRKKDGSVTKSKLRRSKIEIDNVKGEMLEDNIGIIYLNKFSGKVAEKTRKIFSDLKKNGAAYIILDLRDNPGGTLEEAIAVSSIFTKKDPIVIQESKEEKKVFGSLSESDESIPLVVLINNGSASGSEIVAACLKSHKRAILMGEKTYGKGSVQAVAPISSEDPDKGAIKLTIAKFLGPKDEIIDGKGVEPHICIGQDSSAISAILDEEAKSLRHFENFYIKMLESVDKQKKTQLQSAINIIKSVKGKFDIFFEGD